MDKNSIIGFVLIAFILIGFSWWTQPSTEEQRAAFVRDSIEDVKKEQELKAQTLANKANQEAAKEKAALDSTTLFYNASTGTAQNIVLKNKSLELTFNTKGATVTKAYIRNQKGMKRYVGHNIADRSGEHDDLNGVTLFSGNDQELNYTLVTKETNISTSDLYFQASNITDSTVTFTADAGAGKSLSLTYKLGSDYMLHLSIRAQGMSGLFDPNTSRINVDWKDRIRQQERGYTFENRYARLDYKDMNGSTHYLSETGEKHVETEEITNWIAYKNQFFSAVMISRDGFDKGSTLSSKAYEKTEQEGKPVHYLKDLSAQLKTKFDPSGVRSSDF